MLPSKRERGSPVRHRHSVRTVRASSLRGMLSAPLFLKQDGIPAVLGDLRGEVGPTTLSDQEVLRLLRETRKAAPRDHMVFALAVCGGLRLSEIVALNVGDIRDSRGQIRWRVRLPKSKRRPDYKQEAVLSQKTTRRLRRWLKYKRSKGQPIADESPLFMRTHGPRNGNRVGRGFRLGKRSVQYAWTRWQKRLGFLDGRGRPLYRFHDLRHTAVAKCLDNSGNLEVARRFARHASANTTRVYAHVKPETIVEAAPDF